MKRPIGFRVWNGEGFISPDYIQRDGSAWWKENSIPTMSKDLMQYTGMKDIEGNKIYEMDIVMDCYGLKRLVRFKNGSFGLCRSKNSPMRSRNILFSQRIFRSKIKIIGNYYESPQLLEKYEAHSHLNINQ